MDSHGFETQNELSIYFRILSAVYLNKKDKHRNMTNCGIVVFWCHIELYILLSIQNNKYV